MGLIKFINELAEVWREAREKNRKQEEKYRIDHAFTSGGVKYYRFADITNLPVERGLTALQVYNEVEMRCSAKFLRFYVSKMKELLHAKEIDIYKINALNEILEERLNLTIDVELLYKLASVCFFDKTENPCVYEPAYAEKKIARWRKDQKVAAFFSQKPMKELMPFLTNVGLDLDAYMPINQEINQTQEQLIRTITSIKKQTDMKNGKK